MNYKAEIESRVCGIPCLLGVIDFEAVKGSYSHNAPSDLDYYGYIDCSFEVLDRRGRPAPWLEKKMSPRDFDLAEQEVIDYMMED